MSTGDDIFSSYGDDRVDHLIDPTDPPKPEPRIVSCDSVTSSEAAKCEYKCGDVCQTEYSECQCGTQTFSMEENFQCCVPSNISCYCDQCRVSDECDEVFDDNDRMHDHMKRCEGI